MRVERVATMRSEATRDITLSDGTRLPKGEVVAVSATRMMDPNVYEDPEKWDGYRYLRWRNQPEMEAIAQLASTSADSYGFGWFPRACPGRFFAAHSLKIALAYILIRYDINPVEGEGLKFFCHSFVNRVHPATRIMLRRRDEDLSTEL
jgi:cytochrome P450